MRRTARRDVMVVVSRWSIIEPVAAGFVMASVAAFGMPSTPVTRSERDIAEQMILGFGCSDYNRIIADVSTMRY